jgi:hypothetical protein
MNGHEHVNHNNNGLTKRELFAALAAQGYCLNENSPAHKIAKQSVILADALIAELNEVKDENQG